MKNVLLPKAIKLNKDRKQRKWWQRAVRVMAMAVVFCTTYALILPAITMEGEPACGIEAHTHGEGCYTEKPVTAYVCGLEKDLHTHTDTCYAQTTSPACQYVHTHTDSCAAVTKTVLTCTLEESQGHAHSEACATTERVLICTLAESAPHTHGEGCTAAEQVQVCTLEESEAHTHGAECFTTQTKTVCTLAEGEGHTHGDACYETKTVPCQIPESEGHAHGETCYTQQQVPCDLTVNDGHVHEESCYVTEKMLTCTIPEEAPHVHVESCLQETGEMEQVLTCELPEHTHEDSCYPLEEEETGSEYLCGMGVHAHGAECYDAEGNLFCTIPEHAHEAACLVEGLDLTADVETAQDWQDMFADLTLTGNWPEDLLAVANTQLGYKESEKNVLLTEDGLLKGYTRYGAWYGTPYGDWNESFVAFCLHFAEIENFPTASDCESWIEKLTEAQRYAQAEGYIPKPGDLVFFDDDRTAEAETSEESAESEETAEAAEETPITPDRVAIVAELIAATEEEPARIKVIEGDSNNAVSEVTYDQAAPAIIGYGILPEHGYICGQEVHTHETACYDETGALTCTLEEHTHSEACYEEPQEEEIPLVLPLTCTVEEHTHSAQCFGEAVGSEASCGKTEHTHTDACYGPATASFPYEDERITMTVTVTSAEGLPEGLSMEVLLLDAEDQAYASYEDYALENASGELFGLSGYRVRFCYEGKEITLTGAEITADLTVKPVEYVKPEALAITEMATVPMLLSLDEPAVMPMALTDEPAEEEETEEPDLLLVTLLQEDGEAVTNGGSASFTGETAEGTQMRLTFSGTNTFALTREAVVNPEFTVEYYAHFPLMQYKEKDEVTSDEFSIDIIDTRGNGDGTGGKLPQNGGGYSSPNNGNEVLALLLENTGTTTGQIAFDKGAICTDQAGHDAGVNGHKHSCIPYSSIFKIKTELTLTEVYTKETETYESGMDIESFDKLHVNAHYTLSEVWIKSAGGTYTVYTDKAASEISEDTKATVGENATIISLENVSEYKVHDLEFSNTESSGKKIKLNQGDTVRMVYDLVEGTQNISANFFDYDISDTKAYTKHTNGTYYAFDTVEEAIADIRRNSSRRDGKIYMITDAYGINSADAYFAGSGQSHFAFGNQNTGVIYRNDKVNGFNINGGNGGTSGSFKGCSFGLVDGLKTVNGYLTSFLDYADGIIYQPLFNDEALYTGDVPGKETYERQQLNFTRTGDTYILTSVNGGNDNLGSGITESQLNTFIAPTYAWDTNIVQFANNFWPLDGKTGDNVSGFDMEFGWYYDDNTYDRWFDGVPASQTAGTTGGESSAFPTSDDGNPHNSYFGMEFAVDFTLDGQYCGPLEYLFYGDDDMWVFLTNLNTGTVNQVCDIGGVHGSVGSFTNLWDYIDKNNSAGAYRLNFYYTERGATGSSCYMEFTLPDVTSVTQNTPKTGSVSVEKEVTGAEADENESFEFLFQLSGNVSGLSDAFAYVIVNADQTEASSGSIRSGNTFSLKANQKITIVGIPAGANYTITEQLTDAQGDDYNVSWSGQGSSATNSISGTIAGATTHAYTCANAAVGQLAITKTVIGTPMDSEFKMDVTLADKDDKPLSGTFGSYTFTDGKAEITVEAGKTVTIPGIPVGTKWTVQEQDIAGYQIRYNVDGTPTEADTAPSGTIAHKTTVAVEVVNAVEYVLPNTGGSGTSLFTFGGLLMMAVACVYYVNQIGRKRQKGGAGSSK